MLRRNFFSPFTTRQHYKSHYFYTPTAHTVLLTAVPLLSKPGIQCFQDFQNFFHQSTVITLLLLKIIFLQISSLFLWWAQNTQCALDYSLLKNGGERKSKPFSLNNSRYDVMVMSLITVFWIYLLTVTHKKLKAMNWETLNPRQTSVDE